MFCRAEKTSALPTVIRRGISSEIEDSKRFEQAVQPALVRLLMGVLTRCGINELENGIEAELQDRMETMLKQARKVCQFASDNPNDEDDERVIGDKVSVYIVSRLTVAMDEMKKYEKNHGSRNDDPADMVNIENDAVMANLISKRNALKAEATRACITVQKSMESIFSGNASSNHLPPSAGSLEIQDIMLQIVDQDTKIRFDNEKARLETLKAQVQEGESSENLLSLRDSLKSIESNRQELKEKIADLKATLKALEAQEDEAALQIEKLSVQIEEEEKSDEAKAKQLDKNISEARESVRYGNIVSGLAGMMKTYGKSIDKAIASKTGKKNHKDSSQQTAECNENESQTTDEPITKASTVLAMEDYLSKIRKYFLTEAQFASQIRYRLASKTAEVTALRSELSQYNSVKGLFATSTVTAQIKETITQNERTIKVDTQRLSEIIEEGRSMYKELLVKLETYHANELEMNNIDEDINDVTDTESSATLFPTHLLSGVPAAIRSMKFIEDCNRLVTFVKEQTLEESGNDSNTVGSASVPDGVASSVSGSQPEDSVSVGRCPPSTIAATPLPSLAPKLVWASAGAKKAVASPPKQSLLEIQKEELIRSCENSSRDSSRNDSERSSSIVGV